MREPLLLPLAAIAGGIVLSRKTEFDAAELLIAIACFGALSLAARFGRSRRMAFVCCLCGLVAAGAMADVLHRPGPPPELDAAPREVLILQGCVVEPPVFSEDREQFILELEPGARMRVSLYLQPGEIAPPLRYGQIVELASRVRRPRNYRNPGAFDYVRYLARQDIHWTAGAAAGNLRVLPGECGSSFLSLIFRLRTAGLQRLDRLFAGDPSTAAIARALLLGDSTALEPGTSDGFRRTGTYHALVISGLHITVLAGLLFGLLRLIPLPDGPRLAAAALIVWLYALVTGWSTPVVRASAGFSLYLVARYYYRKGRLLNLLAAVAIGFVLYDPEQLFDASFQLSFLAVAAIGGLAVPILDATSTPFAKGLRGLSDLDRDLRLPPAVAQFRVELRLLAETIAFWLRLRRRAVLLALFPFCAAVFHSWTLLVLSAVSQLGLSLPLAAYFHRISLTGLSANLVVVPLTTLAVQSGFVGLLTEWRPAGMITGMLIRGARAAVEWHMTWEPGWRIPLPPLLLAAALAGCLVLTACLLRVGSRWVLAALFGALALFGVLVRHPFEPRVEPGLLEMTAIDVGQAEAFLVALPQGQLMMIDAGGIPSRGPIKPRFDIGEDVISPYLWTRSITRLDVLVSSHGHEDHLGGMPALVENFRPREIWTGPTPESRGWTAVRQKAEQYGVRIVRLRAGTAFDYGGARIAVLAPPGDYAPGPAPANNDSLVLRVGYGRRSFLFTGDIDHRIEARFAGENLGGPVDVLKVAHHGSRTSTSALFLESARPAFALISAGPDNPFGNPAREVLGRLGDWNTEVYRTDQDGLVTFRTDGWRITAETWKTTR